MFAAVGHRDSAMALRPPFRFHQEQKLNQKNAGYVGAAQLRRIVQLSCETGARFVRERISGSPSEWVMTPKLLFSGRSPVEACRSVRDYSMAILLHELSLGLDCSPSALSGLNRLQLAGSGRAGFPQRPSGEDGEAEEDGPIALYTFAISADLEPAHVQIFGAMIAASAMEVRARLRQRIGPVLEDEAIVRRGFDWSEPLACAMVSEAMADVLSFASEDPMSSIAAGLDFQVEQRFVS